MAWRPIRLRLVGSDSTACRVNSHLSNTSQASCASRAARTLIQLFWIPQEQMGRETVYCCFPQTSSLSTPILFMNQESLWEASPLLTDELSSEKLPVQQYPVGVKKSEFVHWFWCLHLWAVYSQRPGLTDSMNSVRRKQGLASVLAPKDEGRRVIKAVSQTAFWHQTPWECLKGAQKTMQMVLVLHGWHSPWRAVLGFRQQRGDGRLQTIYRHVWSLTLTRRIVGLSVRPK